MSKLFKLNPFIILAVIIAIGLTTFLVTDFQKDDQVNQILSTVDVGQVRQLVSVSGITKAKQIADIGFPVNGIIDEVSVDVGDYVQSGEILVTLDADTLYADRQDAVATLNRALADKDKLLAGPTDYQRLVTDETIISKREALETTKINEANKIANAYRTLLSSGLTMYSDDPEEDAIAPTISGTYTCNQEGSYKLEMFSSAAQSGYSYRLSGLETGTYVASVDQPTAMGKCGLKIIFDNSSVYHNSTWRLDIPNLESSSYITNLNAYTLAVTQADSNIKLAEQALALAEAQGTNSNAPARSEDIVRAESTIQQAQAKIARIDSTIADRSLRAPFSGVITKIDLLPGETIAATPIVTIMGENSSYELRAKIPEIDIGKILVEQNAEMVFDAKTDELITGHITFISPQSIEIDGVSYYEATIKFNQTPTWMRGGLNADINIIITKQDNTLRIPKRFLTETDGDYSILLKQGETVATTSIKVVLNGNDGFVAITGLNAGDTIVAP